MNKHMSTGGFTIIETMIVLALTGLAAVIIFNFVSGMVGNSEFTTAINSAAKSIETVVNQTSNGYYPNRDNFSCNAGSDSPPIISATTTNEQGTNLGCILLGNLVQFSPNGDSSNYTIYPVVGLQYGGANGSDSTAIAQAMPVSVNEASSTNTFKYGLSVASVNAQNSSGQMVPASFVGLLGGDDDGNLENINAQTGTTDSGTEELSLYYLTDAYNPTTDDPIPTSNLQTTSEIEICVTAGASTNNSGLIKIGGSDGGTGVTLQVYSNPSC